MVFDFGLHLKKLRRARHLWQKEAACRLGVTRSTISAYEQNAKTPRLEMLIRMALLYHSSPDDMARLENHRPLNFDDLTPSQQQAIEAMIDRLQREFHAKNERL